MCKYAVLAKYLAALSIDIACIQEHHVTSLQEETTLRKHFGRLGYHIMNYNTLGEAAQVSFGNTAGCARRPYPLIAES